MRSPAGTRLATWSGTVIFRTLTRATLIVLPLAMIGARLHARSVQGAVLPSPVSTTQEVNRCLLLVRTAASRRGQGTATSRSRTTAPIEARPRQEVSTAPTAA
jgi:hypothetical protein